MSTQYDERAAKRTIPQPSTATSGTAIRGNVAGSGRRRLARALRTEWLGQAAASLFWIASVLAYGISYSGDWLQLLAAASWLLANIAALATAEAD